MSFLIDDNISSLVCFSRSKFNIRYTCIWIVGRMSVVVVVVVGRCVYILRYFSINGSSHTSFHQNMINHSCIIFLSSFGDFFIVTMGRIIIKCITIIIFCFFVKIIRLVIMIIFSLGLDPVVLFTN